MNKYSFEVTGLFLLAGHAMLPPEEEINWPDANRGVEILVLINGRMIAQAASSDFRRDLWVQVAAVGEIGDIAELHCNLRPADLRLMAYPI
jgi:hypothetical protein